MRATESSRAPNSVVWALLRIVGPAVLVVGVGTAAVAAWWMSQKSDRADSGQSISPDVSASRPTAADPQQSLLQKARSALQERRLLSPAGDNSIEYYLAMLDIDAQDVVARQALLELIPPASALVSGTIASGELNEARRQFDLVTRMGASELRLASLRAELAQAEQEAARQTALAAQALAAPVEPVSSAAAPELPAAPAQPVAAPVQPPVATPTAKTQPALDNPAPRTAPEPVAVVRETVEPPPAAVAAVREARQIVDTRPAYPSNALQRRVEGWVELELTINANGDVGDVKVVASEPARIFDREAMRAAQRWRFEARQENGISVATRVRKTVNFKLNAG